MRSLVTGCNGFVGSHLIEQLIQHDHHVICLVRKTSNLDWIEHLPMQIFYGDVTDIDSLIPAVKNANYVFHLGGVVRARTEQEFFDVNYQGTVNLLEACRHKKSPLKKFLFISSQAAAGPATQKVPLKETNEPHPISVYGRSKLKAEQAVLDYQQFFPVTIIRPSAVYGPRDDDILELFKFIKFGVKPLLGLKEKYISLIHVQDLIAGIMLAFEKQNSIGQVYFLANDEIYSMAEIETIIEQAMNKRTLTIRIPDFFIDFYASVNEFIARLNNSIALVNKDKALEMKQSYWLIDNSKAKTELGFAPKISLRDGVQKTLEWYRKNGWL